MSPRTLTANCPAKINLTLRIVGRRDDGFHELESWVAPVGLYDELTVTTAEELTIAVSPDGAAPANASNLVMKAARLLASAAQIKAAASISLIKQIPAGAGLGGGSSNAAFALRLLNELWQSQLSEEQLATLAAELGSDVPLFLRERQVIMRGRGELLESHPRPWQGWAVLILPAIEVPTAAVYQAYAQQMSGGRGDPNQSTIDLIDPPASAIELMPQLFNDLESAAFVVAPRLLESHQQLNGRRQRIVRMTGSGSAFFTLFDREDEATAWRASVRDLVEGEARLVTVPLLT